MIKLIKSILTPFLLIVFICFISLLLFTTLFSYAAKIINHMSDFYDYLYKEIKSFSLKDFIDFMKE